MSEVTSKAKRLDLAALRVMRTRWHEPWLEKIEVFTSNHQRILIGKVHHHGSAECLGKSKSALFASEIGEQLYSKELKGKFKVFADIQCLQKMRDLINYY